MFLCSSKSCALALQVGMSPSRMPQAQGIMPGHSNMVGQTPSQGQFLPQTHFTPGSGAVSVSSAMNVTVGPGMGQPPAQAPVTQVRRRMWSCSELIS